MRRAGSEVVPRKAAAKKAGSAVASVSGSRVGIATGVDHLPSCLFARPALARALMRAILEQSPASMCLADPQGCVLYANPAFQRRTGFNATDIAGLHLRDLAAERMGRAALTRLWNTIAQGRTWTGVFHQRKKTGGSVAEQTTVLSLRNDAGELMFVLKTGEDRAETQRLRREARTDALTGLLNRRGFDEAASRIWRLGERHGFSVGLLVIDLDRFKRVNDRRGHPAGDRVLKACAKSIRGAVRDSDLVCRHGGDEFAVLLPWADAADTVRVAERVRAAMASCTPGARGRPVPLTASIGASATPCGTGTTLGDLLRRADQALYQAKRGGRDRSLFLSCPPSERSDVKPGTNGVSSSS